MGEIGKEMIHGMLDLLILRALADGPRHGWSVSERLKELSGDVLSVHQGSLYPALYRLEDMGLIEPEWGVSDRGRRAKFYHLTSAGRTRIGLETRRWTTFAEAIGRVIDATGDPERA